MVFFDDNPLHRESVRTFLPEVDVPELPVDSHLYTKTLHSLTYFPSAATTDEDAMRGNLYVTERLRKSAEKNFTEREDFLKDLGLEIYVSCNDTSSVPRIAQLTEKTNQFNTHKTPLNEEDVLAYMSNPEHKAFTMRVIDRFGDYGIVGVALVTIQGDTWNVDQLLLSCRILSRGAEDVFVATIATAARDSGASALSFSYKETEKNAPAKNFLAKLSNAPYQIDLTTTTVSVPRYITECHYSE
jgi:FkbH-like protein